jgi:hypothetical protein
MLQLGARDQGLEARIGLDLGKRFKLIGKGKDLMTARFKHAADDQPRGAARID